MNNLEDQFRDTALLSQLSMLDNINYKHVEAKDLIEINYGKAITLYQLLMLSVNDDIVALVLNCSKEHVGQCADDLSTLATNTLINPMIEHYNNNYSLNIGDTVKFKVCKSPNNVTNLNIIEEEDDEFMRLLIKEELIIIKEKPILTENSLVRNKHFFKNFKDKFVTEPNNIILKNANAIVFESNVINESDYQEDDLAFKLAFVNPKLQKECGEKLAKYDVTQEELVWDKIESSYYKVTTSIINKCIINFCKTLKEWVNANSHILEQDKVAKEWLNIFNANMLSTVLHSKQMNIGECISIHALSFYKSFNNTYGIIQEINDSIILKNNKKEKILD